MKRRSKKEDSKKSQIIEVIPAKVQVEEAEAVDDSFDDVQPSQLPGNPENLPTKVSSSTALTKFDALDLYLKEIARYPRLSHSEERSLAVSYIEKKDVEAARKLVVSNLWVVVKIAREYEAAARNLLDLIQEGNMGLMEAVKNFDPYKEVRFPSYASWWIKAYIIRYVIANWRLVKIGTTQAQRKLFFNLKREKEKLEREGFSPTPKLLADRLSVRESDVVEMEQRMGSSDVSVDTPLSDDSDSTLHSVLPSPAPNAESLLSQRESKERIFDALREFSSKLTEREKIILEDRLLGEDKVTLQEFSDKFKLSKERVRQLETRIKEKLKVFLEERFGETISEIEFGE